MKNLSSPCLWGRVAYCSDRLPVYEQQGLMPGDALQNEFERSVELLQVDGLKGAAQFADGKSVTGHLTVKKSLDG